MCFKKMSFIVLAASILAACANNTPKTQYEWGNYGVSLYSYFKDGNIAENIELVEKDISDNDQKQKKIAPGIHAHLGLLYAKNGEVGKAYNEFELEKKLYPDSSHFMDYLLKNQGAR